MRDPQGRPDIREFAARTTAPASSRSAGSTATARACSCSRTTATSPNRAHPSALRGREGVPRRGRGHARRPSTSARCARGVELDDGPARARVGAASSTRVRDRGQLALVMTEGRKREVRRMLAAVGLPGHPAGPRPDRPVAPGHAGAGAVGATSPPTRCWRSRKTPTAAASATAAGSRPATPVALPSRPEPGPSRRTGCGFVRPAGRSWWVPTTPESMSHGRRERLLDGVLERNASSTTT